MTTIKKKKNTFLNFIYRYIKIGFIGIYYYCTNMIKI